MKRVALLAGLVACGGLSEPVDSIDGAVDAGASSDVVSTDAAPACDPNRPFSTPQRSAELSTAFSDESARLSPDRREAFVSRRVQTNIVQTFRYHRVTVAAAWEVAGPEATLSVFPDGGATSATNLTFATNALEVVLQYYDVPESPAAGIARATRPSVGAPWSVPVAIAGLESPFQDNAPTLSQDGNTLYWFNDRAGSWRISFAQRNGDAFGPAALLGPLDPIEERFPVLTGDERTLYFAARDAGGTTRVRKATRASKSDAFGAAVAVPELDGAVGESTHPTWLSPDGCEMLLLAQRAADGGGFDVYRAVKGP